MAEIKSTLELAMERTKKISISKEEREEIKGKEILQKVNGLFHRYMEEHIPLNEILREIERMDEKTRTMVKEILLSQWIDALSLNEEDERLLRGIEALKGKEIDEVKEKFHHLLSQCRNEKEKIKEEEKAKSEEVLRREGIYGSAVEPNVEGSQHLEKELGNLDHLYEVKLKELKEHLRTL
jgi:myo-inositol-1-phosphate synthase